MYLKFLSLVGIFTIGLSSQILFAAGPDQIQGALTVTVADYFKQHRSETKYFLRDQTGRNYELHFSREPKTGLYTGMTVKIHGRLSSGIFESQDLTVLSAPRSRGASLRSVETMDAANAPSAFALPAVNPISGVQTTLVYNLVSSAAGASAPTFNNTQLQNYVFGTSGLSVNTYYQQNSKNAVSFSGNVVGPFAITVPTDCDETSITTQSDAAAVASGVDITKYSHRVYMMPSEMLNLCQFGGISTIGGNPSLGWINAGGYSPLNTYINVVLTHELGHGLIMAHAQAIETDGVTLDEYGDNSCVMGDEDYNMVNLDVLHSIQEGWIPTSNIQQVTASGTYTVDMGETQASETQALQIVIPGTTGTMYITYRQPIGLDANLAQPFLGGATIQYWTGGSAKSQLATNYPWGGGLIDGQTYNSTDGLISVKQISHNSTSVTVQVSSGTGFSPGVTPTIVNSASNALSVAPNSFASIYGINIANVQAASATTVPLPTNLDGIQVMVNGNPSPLLYVSPTQINFQVPQSTLVPAIGEPGAAVVDIYFNGQLVAEQPNSFVAAQSVGMYTVPNPTANQPAFLNALITYYKNGQASPVVHTVVANSQSPGTFALNPISLNPSLGTPVLSIYGTGVNGKGGVPTVLIDGQSVDTNYSGPSSESGLDQINVFLNLVPGLNGTVTIQINSSTSQTVLMQVAN